MMFVKLYFRFFKNQGYMIFWYLSHRQAERIQTVGTIKKFRISNSYTMVCPPVHEDKPLVLASGLSHVHVDKLWCNYFIL